MTHLGFGSALTIAALLPGLIGLVRAQDQIEGTTWQLQKFMSMDDTTLTSDDPAKYTLNFIGDGRVAVRADCNRGQAGWSSPGTAELKIGPVATTKMLCGKGSMNDRFLRDLSDVASYTIRDSRLFLALRVDADIYEFEPQGVAAAGAAASPAPTSAAPPTASGAPATKPSFDCKRARKDSVEELICGDPLLAALDSELARLYKLATAPRAYSAAFIRRDQPAWLKTRNACMSKEAATICTRDRYAARISELRAQSKEARSKDDEGISLGPFPYTCEGIDGYVNADFINAEPRLARIQNKTTVWVMEAQPSGSGAKYQGSGGESEMFWSHGQERLFRAGPDKPEAKCQQQVIG